MNPGADRFTAESGYSLPELLVAIAIALIVAAGGAMLVTIAVQSQPRAGDRAADVQQGRTMIDAISREVRQGQTVFNPTPSGFEVLGYVGRESCGGGPGAASILCRVSYSCGSTSCTRTERNPDGSGTAGPRVVVEGISGPNVFTYQGPATDPTYVGINLVFPDEAGEEAVTLADGVELRNHVELAAAP